LIQPLPIDGSDAANTEVTLDIWAIDDPPGRERRNGHRRRARPWP
jgi:hypothetical protein